MSKTKIYKTTFKITVLTEDTPYVLSPNDNDPFGLKALDYDICDGDFIGDIEDLGSEVIPSNKVIDELLAIGNDGSFFGAEGQQ
jgi:hypothetical protein